MEERVVCNDEAPGSKPGFSIAILVQGLPGFEPGSKDSESLVIANYTTGPPPPPPPCAMLGARIELATLGL